MVIESYLSKSMRNSYAINSNIMQNHYRKIIQHNCREFMQTKLTQNNTTYLTHINAKWKFTRNSCAKNAKYFLKTMWQTWRLMQKYLRNLCKLLTQNFTNYFHQFIQNYLRKIMQITNAKLFKLLTQIYEKLLTQIYEHIPVVW